MGSEGDGPLGSWRSTPEGCSRDQAEPPHVGQGETVTTLLWDDMITRDQFMPQHRGSKKSLPARLDIWRTGSGLVGRMETQRPEATMTLDGSVCRTLEIVTGEGRPSMEHGRPTLGGTLTLDCQAGGNHLSGQVKFSGCEY